VATHSLDDILDALDRHRQRATYGAVAKLVDRPPFFLMAGRPRDFRHAWVVNAATGVPTNYGPDDMPADLRRRREILSSSRALEEWLAHPE
jgi:hypothetical protein